MASRHESVFAIDVCDAIVIASESVSDVDEAGYTVPGHPCLVAYLHIALDEYRRAGMDSDAVQALELEEEHEDDGMGVVAEHHADHVASAVGPNNGARLDTEEVAVLSLPSLHHSRPNDWDQG